METTLKMYYCFKCPGRYMIYITCHNLLKFEQVYMSIYGAMTAFSKSLSFKK